jgi:hypothetical protein
VFSFDLMSWKQNSNTTNTRRLNISNWVSGTSMHYPTIVLFFSQMLFGIFSSYSYDPNSDAIYITTIESHKGKSIVMLGLWNCWAKLLK